MSKNIENTYYEKNRARCLTGAKAYYRKHRTEILAKMKEKYFNTQKKTPVCKVCGIKLAKELPGQTKYCYKCLYAKAHGAQAHTLAAARYKRKNKKTLDKTKKEC